MPAPYPLLFTPIILEKIWGGRRLATLNKTLPNPTAKYGESWELADMGATSASGAGGGGLRSIITNGELRGKSIHDAIFAWGKDLIPATSLTSAGGLPLLIKFLDATENLSVQVHPSPAYAAANPDAHLKTECWYIMQADPGALIYRGIKPGVTREEFSQLARANDPRIVDAMIALPAIPGQCHNLPSGTVHALGAGVLVAEVQTPSDTTFRLYDWGRTGREMHIEQALQCATFPGEPGYTELLREQTTEFLSPGFHETRLVTTDFFSVDELRPAVGDIIALDEADRTGHPECCALILLEGHCELIADGGGFPPVALKSGDTALIPANIAPQTVLAAGSNLRALRVGIV